MAKQLCFAGAFSNFFCNLMNADLTLSIAMTTTSTVISLFMLPVNTLLYVGVKYGQEVPIKYTALLFSLGVVVTGVANLFMFDVIFFIFML